MDVSSVHICLTRQFGFSAFCVLSTRAISVCNEVVVAVFVCGCVHIMMQQYAEERETITQSGPGQLSLKKGIRCWKIGLVTKLVCLK